MIVSVCVGVLFLFIRYSEYRFFVSKVVSDKKFGKHHEYRRKPTIENQWWAFLECNLLNDILRPFIALMDIGSGGEAGVAMTNLPGDQHNGE